MKKHLLQSEKRIVVGDIEARDWINFLCIGFYDGKLYRYFVRLSDYFNFIFKIQEREIFFHFGGGYDFLFLLNYAFKHPKKYRVTSMIPRGSKFLSIAIQCLKTGHVVNFRDSSAFLPFALRTLAENFGVETQKGEINYEKIKRVTKKLLTYMKGDHLALHQVLVKYSQNGLISQVGMKLTIASQAFAIYSQLFQKVKIVGMRKETEDFCRLAYQGGRTEIYKPFFDNGLYFDEKGDWIDFDLDAPNFGEVLRDYDINSLYPFVMRDNNFPVAFEGWVTGYFPGKLGIYHAEVYVPAMEIPPLGIVHNGKYIFPTGKFEGYWTSAELDMAKKYGVKITKIYKGALFKNGGKIFKDFVDTVYKLRKDSAADSADNIIYKLIMNSLYGRFGLDKEKEQVVFDDGKEGVRPFMEFTIKKGVVVKLAHEDVTLKTFTFNPISIFVTAYARIYNYEKFIYPYRDRIYYTDTDSFRMVVDASEIETSKELGALKLEEEYDQWAGILPKTYYGNTVNKTKKGDFKVIKMKGFDRRKLEHFSFDDFKLALDGDLGRMKSTTPRRIAKFKESLRRNKKILSVLNESDKSIRSKYDKRIITKNNGIFNTEAIMLNFEH